MLMRLFHVMPVLLILLAGLQQAGPGLTAPVDGQLLQGQVAVTGSATGGTFSYAELAFAYASDPTDTWFLIQTVSQPVQDGTLAVWDTSALTDGDYRLRLRVYFLDGSYQDFFVEGLQVRSEPAPTGTLPVTGTSPALTPSPSPSQPPELSTQPVPTDSPPTAVSARPVAATPLPNPAAISSRSVLSFLVRGALLSLILFAVLGLLLLLRLRRS